MESTVEMIDLHCHILPGLDDGPQTMEESIRMCRIAYQDGIRTIVATPHTLNGVYQNGKSTILSKVNELNDALNNSELRTPCLRRNASCRQANSELSSKGRIHLKKFCFN